LFYPQIANLSDIFTGRLREEIPPTLKAICDSLEDKENLIELNLSDNAFGPAGAEPLIDFLTNNRSLQILRLNNNGLGVGGGTMIAKALLASANKAREENRTSSLHTIICGRNRLEDGSSQALADAFAAHGTLVEVRMPQNGIRPDGISNLVKGLAECKDLKHLDLQDNTFTAKGSQALAKVLPTWDKLTHLNLGDCLLSRRGGLAVSESLKLGKNKKLEWINLQYNEIQSDGISVLALAIEEHLDQLTGLELNGNRVEADDSSIQNVISALTKWEHEDALDELDDMEEIDSEEEEEEEEEEEKEEAEEDQEVEAEANELAEKLGSTHI
jgi:Ran GTPase-activating protein 1